MSTTEIEYYTIDELMAVSMARTIKDEDTVFNGVAVPLPFTAIMLARNTHAPDCIFWGGLLAGLDPLPPFLPPTSGDSVMLHDADPILHLHQIFDLAMRGELNRIFLSGAQIDKYGNLNNTLLGSRDNIRVKLPGGAGASHIACFARNFTIWSVRHEVASNAKGTKRFSFVDHVDFITTMGQKTPEGDRKSLQLKGGGPDCVVTDLGIFDFDPARHLMKVRSLHPGVSIERVQDNTEFDITPEGAVAVTQAPAREEVAVIRRLDPLNARKFGFSSRALEQKFDF